MDWIDIKERAPAYQQRVLLAGRYVVTVGYRQNYDDSEAPYFADETEWIGEEGSHSYYEVTHWMPLPELPARKLAPAPVMTFAPLPSIGWIDSR
jgi:hypothetical protein